MDNQHPKWKREKKLREERLIFPLKFNHQFRLYSPPFPKKKSIRR